MMRLGNGVPWIVSAIALFGLVDCGIYGGGGGGGGGGKSTADVEGNIEAVLPGDTGRDIVVIVYRLDKGEVNDCHVPDLPDDNDSSSKDTVVEDGETNFRVSNSKSGRLVVAFLLDGEGRDADGRIDPGDPVALLNDPDCVLDDVPEDYLVNIANARINFSIDDQIGFPAPGRAEADVTEGPEN